MVSRQECGVQKDGACAGDAGADEAHSEPAGRPPRRKPKADPAQMQEPA